MSGDNVTFSWASKPFATWTREELLASRVAVHEAARTWGPEFARELAADLGFPEIPEALITGSEPSPLDYH